MEGSQTIRRAPTARGIRLILPMCSIGERDRYCWDSGNKFPVSLWLGVVIRVRFNPN